MIIPPPRGCLSYTSEDVEQRYTLFHIHDPLLGEEQVRTCTYCGSVVYRDGRVEESEKLQMAKLKKELKE